MTKKEHIQYWIESTKKDWQAMNSLFKSSNYVHCLFFAHLALEKLCKAHWVKENKGNFPPKIHNLIIILNKTKLKFSEDQLSFLDRMNEFQLEGRYPDFTMRIYKVCNKRFTENVLKEVKEIKKCLQEKL